MEIEAAAKKTGQDESQEKTIYISKLVNSVYYFISDVFIRTDMIDKKKFTLVVIHNNTVLVHKDYKTSRGAKIAFSRLFKKKSWKESVRALWSHFYDPDKDWLDEKINIEKG